MSPRRIIFLALAIVAAGSTFFIGQMWLKAQRAQIVVEQVPMPEQPAGAFVLVAKGNLPAGAFMKPENLRWQNWPDDGLSPSYVLKTKRTLEEFVGAVARVGLNDGEPITDSRVVKPGDRSFLAVVLNPDYRAVTVNLTPSSGLAGLVSPGDRVDLLGTFKIEWDAPANSKKEPKPHWATQTVLTNVKVLAVDQRLDDQNKDVVVAKTATLEVSPKQAEILSLVSEIGKFSLSLRSIAQGDDPPETPKEANYTWDSEAVPLIAPPPSQRAGLSGMRVTVVRGADVKDIDFAGGSK